MRGAIPWETNKKRHLFLALDIPHCDGTAIVRIKQFGNSFADLSEIMGLRENESAEACRGFFFVVRLAFIGQGHGREAYPMNLARTLFAVLLALLAVLNAIGHFLLWRDPEPIHAIEHVSLFAETLCFAVSAYYFFRPRSYWDRNLACPHCQQRGLLRLSPLGQPRISVLAFIFTGFIGCFLYRRARKHRFHCDSCGGYCFLQTAGGVLASAWLLWIIFAISFYFYLRIWFDPARFHPL